MPKLGAAEVGNANDRRVIDAGCRSSLLQNALGRTILASARLDHFDGDRNVERRVVRKPDRTHAATAQAALELILPAEHFPSVQPLDWLPKQPRFTRARSPDDTVRCRRLDGPSSSGGGWVGRSERNTNKLVPPTLPTQPVAQAHREVPAPLCVGRACGACPGLGRRAPIGHSQNGNEATTNGRWTNREELTKVAVSIGLGGRFSPGSCYVLLRPCCGSQLR